VLLVVAVLLAAASLAGAVVLVDLVLLELLLPQPASTDAIAAVATRRLTRFTFSPSGFAGFVCVRTPARPIPSTARMACG
jgi:hypothetical protein